MAAPLRSVLVGQRSGRHRLLVVALAFGVFGTTLAAYVLGIFAVSGGVVWIPFHAAVVGTIAACWIGYSRSGLLFGWLVTVSALLGYHAEHAFFGLSEGGFLERLAYFVRPDALVVLTVEGIVLGTVAFAVGALLRWGIEPVRRHVTPASPGTDD